MRNPLRKLTLQGKIGQILSANEANWLHPLFEDDPGLLAGFADQSDTAIFKTMWHGEFPGKLLTGIAQTYLLGNHPATRALGDRLTAALRDVQEESGYLGPWPQDTRFERDAVAGQLGKWDTWGHYHCIYGLYRWYQVTGNKTALNTALRALDCIYHHFIAGGVSIAAQKWAECNLAIAHAFALFYEETGDDRYLAAAERLVREDMTHLYPDFYTQTTLSCNWLNQALAGIPYHASGQPRWEGLYTLETFAVLYRTTGNDEYRRAVEALWRGMVASDRHNTGSFGTGEGATGNLYGAGSETCNTVAWMAFTTDYLAMTRDPLAADELELSFFNATLGSLLAGERNFTYMNDSNGSRAPALDVLREHSFVGGRDMSCCQANGNRGLSEVAEWALLGEGRNLCLNYYGPCVMTAELENGHTAQITQNTDYPRSGRVFVSVETNCDEPLTLYFRIPAWSKRASVTVNGEPVAATAGSYCSVTRIWTANDVVELDLDMSPHFWRGDIGTPAEGNVSVYYGPILLARRGTEDTPIPFAALQALTPTMGEGIVTLTADTTNVGVTLMDYYTAGRDGAPYTSWISCENVPEQREPDKPIWCQA
jgi:DUF1680 family protein